VSGGGTTEIDKKPNKVFGGLMKRIGTTSSGNIIVEMTPQEWAKKQTELAEKEDLSSLMKRYREENHVTQKTLASQCGISRNTIIAIERGQRANLKTIEKILAAIIGESKSDHFYLRGHKPNRHKKVSRPRTKGQIKGSK
jgi:DNA-binding XRE family transcriptional regulator